MAEILKIDSKKKCYLLHNDILVVNVPCFKMNESVIALNEGKTDTKSLWAKYVFNLKKGFRMEYDAREGLLALSQGQMDFIEDAEEIEDIYFWLSKNLKRRHFFPASVPVNDKSKLIRGLTAIIVVAILAIILVILQATNIIAAFGVEGAALQLMTYYLSAKNIMIATMAVCGLIAVWSLLSFVKSKTFLEVYEMGYKNKIVNAD